MLFPFWLLFKKESKERKAEKESFKIQFKENLERILPIFSKEFGYLPEFEVDYLNKFEESGLRKRDEVMVTVSFHSFKYFLLYGHDFFKTLPRLGKYTYLILHEVSHFYQFDALGVKAGGSVNLNLLLQNYKKWCEGLAELCALKLLHNLYVNFEELDSRLGIKEICTKEEIKETLIKRIRYYRVLIGLIGDKLKDDKLILPFEIDPEIEITSRELLEEKIEKAEIKYMKLYIEGMIILGKLIRKRGLSLKDVLSQPLSNYQMDKLKREL